ncbi:MAG: aminotransferase class I/II-fold pyridoxal phosphate-dependent enzyme [Saprospiraceae bacterium]|jgi:glycine C-acetyltransferase|nr:aminotransferase class I/II-fold pyridoxal phosphate-dependent enzyme [Saprospiraceae bacterium]
MATTTSLKPTSNLNNFLRNNYLQPLQTRVENFHEFVQDLSQNNQITYQRTILSESNRMVTIWDNEAQKARKMLMFASNNYLGLSTHPYVKEKTLAAAQKYGIGMGGPPLLNGFSKLMAELEERLAALKHCESAMVFSSGYNANLGLISGITQRRDYVVYDELCHASFYDGLNLSKAKSLSFKHNSLIDLEEKLKKAKNSCLGEIFVATEGVFSMDGDLPPLDQMVPIVKKYGAILVLDDAHSTGVIGKNGTGTAEHFHVEKDIDITVGTFSKSFAVAGGFVAASKEIINYLRYFARSYMFSAALPPMVLAAVLAGLEVMENEPELRKNLRNNIQYAISKLEKFGFASLPQSAVIALKAPTDMNIRKANFTLSQRGVFLNAVEYPAVSISEQRFRISLMAQHTKEDIDKLCTELESIWSDPTLRQ